MPKLRIPELHSYQKELVEAQVRFCYVVGGRRSGKSLASMFRQALFAWHNKNTNHWTIDQTHDEVRKWFRYVLMLLPPDGIRHVDKTEKRIELANGAVWNFRSAEDPAKMRGSGLHSVVWHEAAFCLAESWQALRPALSDYLGWAIINSTPRGLQNWFAAEYQRAKESEPGASWENSRRAFLWPTELNPGISKAEIQAAREELPDAMFRQEYLGEFISDAGSLFKVHPNCWTGRFEAPQAGARYAVGVDLGKRRDWTSWAIIRCDVLPWRLVEFGRIRFVEYTTQADMLAEQKIKRYDANAPVLIDQSQETVAEILRQRGCKGVETFAFTGVNRPTVLQNLAVVLERGEMRFASTLERARKIGASENGNTPEQDRTAAALEGELLNFTPQVTKRGTVRYEAAHGFHDDMVFALALAVEAAKKRASGANDGWAYMPPAF